MVTFSICRALLGYIPKTMNGLLWILWILRISWNRADIFCYSRPFTVLELQMLTLGWPFQFQLSCFILGWAAWSLPTHLWFSCQRCEEGCTQNLELPTSGSLLLEILPSSWKPWNRELTQCCFLLSSVNFLPDSACSWLLASVFR